MAVTRRRSIRDYNRYYMRRSILLLLLPVGIAAAFATITHLILTNLAAVEVNWYIIILLGAVGGIIGAVAITPSVSKPMRDVLYATAYKTGELTAEKPAKINSPAHARTGFQAVLEAIYTNGAPAKPTAKKASSQLDAIIQSFNHTPCGIVVLDHQQHIIFANETAPVVSDMDGVLTLGLDFIDEISINEWIQEVAKDNITAHHQWTRVPAQAKTSAPQKFYDVSASYEKGAAGETVIILFDRSAKYLPEEEDLNFIAFAAHELRGPITVIRGYLDILEQELHDRLRDDEPQLFNRLTVSANRLSSYINNILNVSKFDRHHLYVHLREDTLEAIYATIADDMQLRASAQHRMLNVSIPSNLPTVAADRGSIGEVISNLIDNAIKYSFEGGVVQVSAVQKGEFVEVSVSDNGVGMPAGVIKNLFRKFYRSHRSRETVAGTGIGLYICKAFVESHGGSISARSQENQGSIFSFTIPVYASVKEKLLEDGQLNNRLIRTDGGWIKNHKMYRE